MHLSGLWFHAIDINSVYIKLLKTYLYPKEVFLSQVKLRETPQDTNWYVNAVISTLYWGNIVLLILAYTQLGLSIKSKDILLFVRLQGLTNICFKIMTVPTAVH